MSGLSDNLNLATRSLQRTLAVRAGNSTLNRDARNVSILRNRASTAFDSLKAIKTISDRAGEIATLADGTRSPKELQAYAAEITQLIKRGAQLTNVQHNGDYIFSGTKTDRPPYVVATDANGNVTSVTYQGNAHIAQTGIGQGVTGAVDVPGENTTGSGPRGLITDSRNSADFFNHLISLQNHLRAGDTDAIAATDRPALGTDEDNLIFNIAENGAVQMRFDTGVSSLSTRSLSVGQLISNEADADLSQTLVQLNQTQTAYQAALQSASIVMATSLLGYVH
jgi:flagellar hook-associated protein 3 FlgL